LRDEGPHLKAMVDKRIYPAKPEKRENVKNPGARKSRVLGGAMGPKVGFEQASLHKKTEK